MLIKQYDTVILKDGREAAIVEVLTIRIFLQMWVIQLLIWIPLM